MEEVKGLVVKTAEQIEISKRYAAQLEASKRVNESVRDQIVVAIMSGKAPQSLAIQFQTEELIAFFDGVIDKMNQPVEYAWDDDYTVNHNEIVAMNYIESLLPKKAVANSSSKIDTAWLTYSNDEESLCDIHE